MSSEAIVQFPDGNLPIPGVNQCEKPPALVKPLWELTPAEEGDGNNLLGNRFLCRGSGVVFVGATGTGKSTAVMQCCISWAAGRECFGIKPAAPLKVAIVQAENDEAEMCEMRDGIISGLDFTKEELALVREGIHIAFETARTSSELFKHTVIPLLEKTNPDLLVLDPALSYVGGDANAQEIVGGFLRNIVGPALQKHGCGALIVHHTAKPSLARDANNRVATDYAYHGTGSAEWANWPRGVLVLTAKDDQGLRELKAAKRGGRLGWKDAEDKPVLTRLIRQCTEPGSLYYREVSALETEVLTGRRSAFDQVIDCNGLLPEKGAEISKELLVARIVDARLQGRKICGINKAKQQLLPLLIDEGYFDEFEKPRSTGRPEKWLRRTDKRRNVDSFVQPKVEPKLQMGCV